MFSRLAFTISIALADLMQGQQLIQDTLEGNNMHLQAQVHTDERSRLTNAEVDG